MPDDLSARAKRPAARALVGGYHERELTWLVEHVREGFARLDAGEIDAFELDELIHRDKRSTRELWKFCTLNRPGDRRLADRGRPGAGRAGRLVGSW